MWQLTTVNITGEVGSFESYGIRCGSTEINDISLNRREIEEFVEQLNRCDASEIHARELVEDFLGR